jgi:hypothetical protein
VLAVWGALPKSSLLIKRNSTPISERGCSILNKVEKGTGMSEERQEKKDNILTNSDVLDTQRAFVRG